MEMKSLTEIKEKESNVYKAILIMGREAEWISKFKRTTIEKPVYKAIEHFIDGKIDYKMVEED